MSSLPYGGRLMFTQSWEDPDCDLAGLSPQPGETMLAVTSGADNVLGFLLADPGRIIAIDLNPTQTFLLELKSAALRTLSHSEVLALFGVRSDPNPLGFYQHLRDELGGECREFFDARPQWFARGLLVQGGFERYFALLRTVLRLTVGRRTIERLFELHPAEQREFYDRQWNTRRWRALVRVGCSKAVLGNRLDPSWFAHADVDSLGGHFLRLVEHAIADIPARSNYFLAQILLGRYRTTSDVPAYLRPENFDTIRARLDRIRPVTADVGDAVASLPERSVDVFALSNVFEYSPADLFERTCRSLVRAARPGARFVLRNLLARRSLGDHPSFIVNEEKGRSLRQQDRAFIYSRFETASLAVPQ